MATFPKISCATYATSACRTACSAKKEDLREKIIQACHNEPTEGHLGYSRKLDRQCARNVLLVKASQDVPQPHQKLRGIPTAEDKAHKASRVDATNTDTCKTEVPLGITCHHCQQGRRELAILRGLPQAEQSQDGSLPSATHRRHAGTASPRSKDATDKRRHSSCRMASVSSK